MRHVVNNLKLEYMTMSFLYVYLITIILQKHYKNITNPIDICLKM